MNFHRMQCEFSRDSVSKVAYSGLVGMCSSSPSRGTNMKNLSSGKSKLLAGAVAALFAVTAYSAFADNAVKAGAPYDKPGRAIDDTVKAPGNPDRPGRTLD